MADFQRFDAGRLGISRLQPGDDLAAAVAQSPVLVEIGVGAVADEAAVARVEREASRRAPPRGTARSRAGAASRRSLIAASSLRQAEGTSATHEACAKGVGRADRRANGAEIARTAAPKRQPRQRAGKVGSLLQLLAQALPQPRLVGEIGDRIEPRIHRRRIGQRTAEPAGKLARAGRGDGAVDGGKQAAGARALVRAHQLEIGARGGVDDEQAACAFFPRRPEQRRFADLGDLDISQQPRERRKLCPREFAKRIERGYAEPLLQRSLAPSPSRNGRAGMASARRRPPRSGGATRHRRRDRRRQAPRRA